MPQCTATSKRSGEQCMRLAILGGTVCHMHGGAIPNVKKAALRRLAREQLEKQVWSLVDELDLPMDEGDDPGDALAAARRRITTLASVLWVVVQQLGVAGDVEVAFSPDERVLRSLAGGSGSTKKMAALFGPNHLGDGAPHVAVEMFLKANDQAARLAKMELDAGVDERRVRLDEATGQQLAGVLRLMSESLLELAMSQADEDTRRSLRAAWSSHAGELVRYSIAVGARGEVAPRPAFPVRVVESAEVSPVPVSPLAELERQDVAAAPPPLPVMPPESPARPSSVVQPPPPLPSRRLVPGVVVDDDEDPGDAAFVAGVNAAEDARRQRLRDELEDERRRGR